MSNIVVLSQRNLLSLLYRSLVGKKEPLLKPDGNIIYVEADKLHYAGRQVGPRPADEEDFIKIMIQTAKIYAGV
jgi:hypothetical protein